ncbi:hypothetical protein DUNSADRAFT_7025 [Dunaliella salina]|uniref:Uncharacterized protein n=1 Tax=Dunaliella salina TaxID=3046 RepID=A0ABQ7GM27_DUNSA|nr:hypothetical protein DUNSADRAFT_7025 [Dunaliella salina]|eukprot:KAF5835665.1 hypothetical protein DUNSADRAFT_7025 [Dunaliella salina]
MLGLLIIALAAATQVHSSAEARGSGFDPPEFCHGYNCPEYERLIKYLLGNNELQEQIEMTAPTVTTVRLDEDKRIQPDYTVSFFLPLAHNEIWVLRTKEEKKHHRKRDDKGRKRSPLWLPFDFDLQEEARGVIFGARKRQAQKAPSP